MREIKEEELLYFQLEKLVFMIREGPKLEEVWDTEWRRKWQPTPVFLPGESQGRGSLVGFCLWGHTELDTTEAT